MRMRLTGTGHASFPGKAFLRRRFWKQFLCDARQACADNVRCHALLPGTSGAVGGQTDHHASLRPEHGRNVRSSDVVAAGLAEPLLLALLSYFFLGQHFQQRGQLCQRVVLKAVSKVAQKRHNFIRCRWCLKLRMWWNFNILQANDL